jgi:ATP citrate (pro-S)-lyase
MVTADHGPAVSGAHNTIVCARAGKDLVSCLASGLLTIVRKKINKKYLFLT